MIRRRAFTLLETMVAMGLSLLLSTVVLGLLEMGRNAFFAALDESAVAVASYDVPHDIMDSLLSSCQSSVFTTASAFGFATAYDVNGNFVTDGQGMPVWQAYQLVYLKSGTQNLLQRRIPYSPPPLSSQQVMTFCDGSGSLLSAGISKIQLQPGPINPGGVNPAYWTLLVDYQVVGYARTYQGEVSLCGTPVNN